jgi:acetyl-CoA carboxylase biotin carboxyl carrier protein
MQVAEIGHIVTSPFVGTFYRKPNPDSAIYVSLGERVAKGQTLCIIEAMKLMNEIEADVAGSIAAILVEDGASVEYGQALFRIIPDGK